MKLTTNPKLNSLSRLNPPKKAIHLQQERKRIADDLHDEIGPMLATLKLRVGSIKGILNQKERDTILDEIATDIDFLIHDIRKIIRNITPDKLQRYGLFRSIEDFRSLVQKNNIHFDFRFEGVENNLKEEARINIYRIMMELINNSIKHSRCKIIKLFFKTYPDKTIIVYTDDGCQKELIGNSYSGMGLNSIRSRVDALKGRITFNKDFQNGAFCQILFENKTLLKQ